MNTKRGRHSKEQKENRSNVVTYLAQVFFFTWVVEANQTHLTLSETPLVALLA